MSKKRVEKLSIFYFYKSEKWTRDLRPVAPLMQIVKRDSDENGKCVISGDVVYCLIVSQGQAFARLRWSSDCWALPHDCITFLTWCFGTVKVFMQLISPCSVCLFYPHYPHEPLSVSAGCFGDAVVWNTIWFALMKSKLTGTVKFDVCQSQILVFLTRNTSFLPLWLLEMHVLVERKYSCWICPQNTNQKSV